MREALVFTRTTAAFKVRGGWRERFHIRCEAKNMHPFTLTTRVKAGDSVFGVHLACNHCMNTVLIVPKDYTAESQPGLPFCDSCQYPWFASVINTRIAGLKTSPLPFEFEMDVIESWFEGAGVDPLTAVMFAHKLADYLHEEFGE